MNAVARFARNCVQSPRTSATGLAGLVGCITAAVHDFHVLENPAWWTGAMASLGLLFSADQKQPPTAPA